MSCDCGLGAVIFSPFLFQRPCGHRSHVADRAIVPFRYKKQSAPLRHSGSRSLGIEREAGCRLFKSSRLRFSPVLFWRNHRDSFHAQLQRLRPHCYFDFSVTFVPCSPQLFSRNASFHTASSSGHRVVPGAVAGIALGRRSHSHAAIGCSHGSCCRIFLEPHGTRRREVRLGLA